MTTYYHPAFVSEEADPDHRLDDCVWAAGLMQANGNSGGAHPATLAEAEQIELAAGGPFPAGSTSQELVAGLTKRYGWAPTEVDTPTGIIATLKPGIVATVSGKPGLLPPTSPFRRFTGTGDYGHRVAILVHDGPAYELLDPLAPPNTGYQGQTVLLSDIEAFAKNGSGGTVAALKVVPPPVVTKKLRCASTLRAEPSTLAPSLGVLPAGTICTVLGTASHGWWSLTCGGPHAGRTWLHVTAAGKSGFIPTARF